MGGFRYFLSVQTLLPDDFESDGEFCLRCSALRDLGFDGVELNIRDPDTVSPDRLRAFLGDFGLQFAMFASGLTAKSAGLSLASTDEAVRRRSVERTKGFLDFASVFGAGVIAGFLKGASGESTPAHRAALKSSLAELGPEADRRTTPLLVEAINRFESPLGHSLDDAWDLASAANSSHVGILPDTWHMNIEETAMEAAMVAHRDHFVSFHISDNNRFFPGFGGIDFRRVVAVLDALGYRGKLAIEGNLKVGFAEDLKTAVRYLEPIIGT